MSIFKIIYFFAGIALLAFIFNKIDFELFLNELYKLKFNFLIILIIYLIGFFFDSCAWAICIKTICKTKIKLFDVLKIKLIGEAFNYIILQLGGEPIKAYLLKKKFNIKYKNSVASLVLAKTIILIALIIFCMIGLFGILKSNKFGDYYEKISIYGFIFFTFLIFTFFLVQRYKIASKIHRKFKKRLTKKINIFFNHIKKTEKKISDFYRFKQKEFFQIILLNLCNWLMGAIELYVILFLMDQKITLVEAIAIETLVQLVRSILFFLPSNIGAQEGVFVLVIDLLKNSMPLGLAVAIIRRMRELIWISLGLVVGYNQKIDFRKIKKKL